MALTFRDMPDVKEVEYRWFPLPHVLGNGTMPVGGQGPHSHLLLVHEGERPDEAFLLHVPATAHRLTLQSAEAKKAISISHTGYFVHYMQWLGALLTL